MIYESHDIYIYMIMYTDVFYYPQKQYLFRVEYIYIYIYILYLIRAAENMRIILMKAAKASQSCQCPRCFIATYRKIYIYIYIHVYIHVASPRLADTWVKRPIAISGYFVRLISRYVYIVCTDGGLKNLRNEWVSLDKKHVLWHV
jgi:hypothetical protein